MSSDTMRGQYDAEVPPNVAKTTLYHIARLWFRLYIGSLLVVSGLSLIWIADLTGFVPSEFISVVWIGIAVMGLLFLLLLVPLYRATRRTER